MRCVVYARYSSDGQREESVEGQLRECKEYAERHNMTVVSCYIEACDIIEPTQRSLINQGFQGVGHFFNHTGLIPRPLKERT